MSNQVVDIKELQEYYNGFTITEPIGNNAFSYSQRKNKEIAVAPLIEGACLDLKLGEKTAFCEICDGKEIAHSGLKNFICLRKSNKDIFIFDNHNHAFFFWAYARKKELIPAEKTLVHIDQHTDMREPDAYLEEAAEGLDLDKAFQYTQDILNVGNFLKPALASGIFREIKIINTLSLLEQDFGTDLILDIDLDFLFEPAQSEDFKQKLNKIKLLLNKASFVTIATSPYFLDQAKAIDIIQQLEIC